MQQIEGFIWADWVVDKLDWKHGVALQMKWKKRSSIHRKKSGGQRETSIF